MPAYLKQILASDVHILSLLIYLVRLGHVLIEDLQGQGDQGWVGHPSAIMPILHLSQLVCLHLCHVPTCIGCASMSAEAAATAAILSAPLFASFWLYNEQHVPGLTPPTCK